MILFIILSLMIILLIAFLVLAISIGGAVSVILFGDVIVCIFIIGWILKRLFVNKSYRLWKHGLSIFHILKRRSAIYEKSRDLQRVIDSSKIYLKRNSSTVLTAIGAVGVLITSIMTAKATVKAFEIINEEECEKKRELTKKK